MKIQTRITLAQVFVLITFIILFFVIQVIEKTQNNNVVESLKTQQQETTQGIINLKTEFLEKFAHDYTYWDEFYYFFNTKDTTWANENLATLFTTLDIKSVLVFSLSKELIYFKNEDLSLADKNFIFPNVLFDELYKKRELHFYYETDNGIVEFYGATVHKTADAKKIESPMGFFFLGNLLDKKYVEHVAKLSQSHVSISKNKSYDTISDNHIVTSAELNDFNHNIIAYINFTKENKFRTTNKSLLLYSRIYLIFFSLLIVLVFVLSYRIYINRPLKVITETLKTNQPAPLKQLFKKNNEFSQIATMIQDFFNQKQDLEQEIIEHRVTEEKLIKSESRLKDLFELLPQIIFEALPDGRLSFVNKTALELTGYTYEDFSQGLYVFFMVAPEQKEKVIKNMNLISKGLKGSYQEYTLIRKNGTSFPVLINTTAINNNGIHCGFRGVITDITELKEQEQKLKKSEELYRIIVEIATDVFYTISIDGKIQSLSNSFEKFLGWKKEFWLEKDFIDIIHPDDVEFALYIHNILINGKTPPTFEHRVRKLDGSYANVEFSASPLYQDGKVIGTIGSAIDITLRKRAIEQLKQSENLYLRTINSLYTWLHVVDKDLKIILLNEALEKVSRELFGEKSIKGLSLLEAFPFLNQKTINEYHQIFKDGTENISEESLKLGKKLFYLEVKRVPVFSGTEVEMVVTTMRDVTDQRLFEQKILRTTIETQEKERKRFAEDLHDGLGPLLSSIKLYINELGSNCSDEERNTLLSTSNELIDEAVFSAKSIANNLMPNTLSDFGLIPAIKSFCIRLNSSKAINISFNTKELETRFDKNIEISIYRIITELINNTIKHASAKNINIYIERVGYKINILYEDDGIGFNVNDILNNKSSAMGINNIKSRVNSLQGKFEVLSSANQGCKIQIKLFLDAKI